jgi:hypothetical protein
MKTRLIIFIILSKISMINGQTFSYTNYLKTKNELDKSEKIIEKGSFKRAIKLLKKIEKKGVPFGLKKSIYSDIGECYLQLGNLKLSESYFIKSFKAGISPKYLNYISTNFSEKGIQYVDFINKLNQIYDSIVLEYFESEGYFTRKKLIIGMYASDQLARVNYLNSKNKSEDSLFFLNEQVKVTDSLNQRSFDSLSNQFGWIGREMAFNENINIHIVLFHASENYRNKYIELGYNQALNNSADWKEIELLQSYSFTRNIMSSQEKESIFLLSNDASIFDCEKVKFLAYSLCYELADGGTFNGKEKKVRFLVGANFPKGITKEIKKVFKKFGIQKSKFEFTQDLSTNNLIIKYI